MLDVENVSQVLFVHVEREAWRHTSCGRRVEDHRWRVKRHLAELLAVVVSPLQLSIPETVGAVVAPLSALDRGKLRPHPRIREQAASPRCRGVKVRAAEQQRWFCVEEETARTYGGDEGGLAGDCGSCRRHQQAGNDWRQQREHRSIDMARTIAARPMIHEEFPLLVVAPPRGGAKVSIPV